MGPKTRPVGRTVNSQHPLARGLVSFHLCLPNLTKGTTFYDIVNHYDATLNSVQAGFGFQASKRYGGFGTAIKTDGVSGHDVTRTTSVPIAGFPCTLAVWFNPTTASSEAGLISVSGTTSANQIGIELFQSSVYAYINSSSGEVAATPTVSSGVWNFATATFVQNTQFAYLNGTGKSTAGSATGTPTSLINLRLGSDTFDRLAGFIDCCMIYNRALSDAEVLELYLETIRGCPSLLRRISSPRIFFTPPVTATSPVGVVYQLNQSVKSASFF